MSVIFRRRTADGRTRRLVLPSTSGTGVTVDVGTPLEGLVQLNADLQVGVENLGVVSVVLRRRTADGRTRRQFVTPGVASVTVDVGVPLEGLAQLNADRLLALESLGGVSVTVDVVVPLEDLTNLNVDPPIPLEDRVALSVDVGANLESRFQINVDSLVDLENTAPLSVTVDVAVPIEVLAQWNRDAVAALEFSGTSIVVVPAFVCVSAVTDRSIWATHTTDVAIYRGGFSDSAYDVSLSSSVARTVVMNVSAQLYALQSAPLAYYASTRSDVGLYAVAISELACKG